MRSLLMFVAAAGSIFGQACDRACLEGFVDKYMDALVAHDPKLVPLAATLKNTENGQRLEPGDGFWRTATAKGVYRLFVDDPQAGVVAFLGTMKEANIPVSVAIRLKIANQQISEIETFVVRTGMNGTNGAPELEKLRQAARGVSGAGSGGAARLPRGVDQDGQHVLLGDREE
jgi:hypothetical protein